MKQHPYRRARRVFWIVDNSSSHRGSRAVERLQDKYPNLVLVHGPVHASGLNQIEFYFSILQRKALTPNDFASLNLSSGGSPDGISLECCTSSTVLHPKQPKKYVTEHMKRPT